MDNFLLQLQADAKSMTKDEFANRYLYLAQTKGKGSLRVAIPEYYRKAFNMPETIYDNVLVCIDEYYEILRMV